MLENIVVSLLVILTISVLVYRHHSAVIAAFQRIRKRTLTSQGLLIGLVTLTILSILWKFRQSLLDTASKIRDAIWSVISSPVRLWRAGFWETLPSWAPQWEWLKKTWSFAGTPLKFVFFAALTTLIVWGLIELYSRMFGDKSKPKAALIKPFWERMREAHWYAWFYSLPTYSRGVIRTFGDITKVTSPRRPGSLSGKIFGGIKFKLPWQTVEIYSQELQTLQGLETEMQFTAGDLETQRAAGIEYGRESTRMLGPQAKFRMMLRFYFYDIRQWLRQDPDTRGVTETNAVAAIEKIRDKYFRQMIEGTTQRCQSKMRIPDMKNLGGVILLYASEARITALKTQVASDIRAIPGNSGITKPTFSRDFQELLSDTSDLYLRDTDADAYWRWLERHGRELGIMPHVSDFRFYRERDDAGNETGNVVPRYQRGLTPDETEWQLDNDRSFVTHLSKVDPNDPDHTTLLNAYFERLNDTNPHALQLRVWRDGILIAELQSKDVEPEKDIVTAITELGKASIKRNQTLVELRSKLDTEQMVLQLRTISADGDVMKARKWLEGAGLPVTGENVLALLKFHQVFRSMEEMAQAEGRGANFVLSVTDVLRAAGVSGLGELAGTQSSPIIKP